MEPVKRFLLQTFAELDAQRPAGCPELVHFTESLATTVIEEYSNPGDLVLDPFAGFGTTMVVAERLGRRGYGVELLQERVNQISARLRDSGSIVLGDARNLAQLVRSLRGSVSLVLTSPPYMSRNDHPENPLDAYATMTGDYGTYLEEIAEVFADAATLLRPDGHVVVNVANIVHDGVLTPLAWDMARAISARLTLVQECYLAWDSQPADISGDYCLVFRQG